MGDFAEFQVCFGEPPELSRKHIVTEKRLFGGDLVTERRTHGRC